MDPITVIFWIVIAACLIWVLAYACDRFEMPQPVKWLCGLIVIVMLFCGFYLHNLPAIHF